MPQPRTTRDLERPLRDRERGIVLNRNRNFQRRITPAQAANNAGTFAREARRRRVVGNRGGAAGAVRRPRSEAAQAASRAGLLSRARSAVNNIRANFLRNRAARNRARARGLRNG